MSLKSSRGWVASAVILTLGVLTALSPTLTRAALIDPDVEKKSAVAAIQTWLAENDAGNYAKTWSEAAKSFQKVVPSDRWVSVNQGTRAPLGKLIARKLASAAYLTHEANLGTGVPAAIYVIAQYDTSFENMKYARETVTFEKEADGVWRAAGYYIKPQ
jgi:hypothetical protein